jgi:hypothetical protein
MPVGSLGWLRFAGDISFAIIMVSLIGVRAGVEEGDVGGLCLENGGGCWVWFGGAVGTGGDVGLRGLLGDGEVGALGVFAEAEVGVGGVVVGRLAFHPLDGYFGLGRHGVGGGKGILPCYFLILPAAKLKSPWALLLLR